MALDTPQTQDQPSQWSTRAPGPDTPTCGQRGPGGLRAASPGAGRSLRQGTSWPSGAVHAGSGDSSPGAQAMVTCPGDVSRRLPTGRPHSRIPHCWHPECPRASPLGIGCLHDEPQENVGIEQESHAPSNAFRMSSGTGASKSSGTVNSPAHKPKGRNCLAPAATGLISATGCPARINDQCVARLDSQQIRWKIALHILDTDLNHDAMLPRKSILNDQGL